MKKIKLLTLLLVSLSLHAQNKLIVLPNIALLKDTSENRLLRTSLDNFLLLAQKPNEENSLVLESGKVETFILLDEINGIEKSARMKDDFFYKPYLTNVVPLENNQYLIQLSYIGVDNSIPYLRASFELVAHKAGATFQFASPLLRNTAGWKTAVVGNNTFHYRTTINQSTLKEFGKLTSFFDKKLQATGKRVDYYCCDDILELQKLVGVLYKSDYNGRSASVWSSSYRDQKLIVLGNKNETFNHFDPHDLFHDRLSLVVARNKINKPVDEGCAYLYGGSWGFSWKEIYIAFKDQVASNKNLNWKEVKDNPVYFKTGEYNNSADNIVNALLIQEIEKKKGFAGVWKLLNVGPVEKGHAQYYQTLEQLTGIAKDNYNEKVWALVNSMP